MLNHHSKRLVVLIAFATSQCLMASATQGRPARSVSVSQLLASPKKYAGQSVTATGYLLYSSKLPAAFPVLCAKAKSSKPSPDSPATIALVFSDRKGKPSQECSSMDARRLDTSPVVVKGVFDWQLLGGRHAAVIRVVKIDAKQNARPSTQPKYGKNGYEPGNHHFGDQAHTGDFWAGTRR